MMSLRTTGYPSFIFLILTIMCWTLQVASHIPKQHLQEIMVNRSVKYGSDAYLPCIVAQNEVVQWTRDGFGLGYLSKNLDTFPRYRISRNEKLGEYSLVIANVTLEDDAVFECQVSPHDAGSEGFRSVVINLTVEIPPGRPIISQGNQLVVLGNKSIKLLCSSSGGKPTAQIIWTNEGGAKIMKDVLTWTIPTGDGKTHASYSRLKILPPIMNHTIQIGCSATNKLNGWFTTTDTSYIDIDVRTATKVNVEFNSTQIRENDTVIAKCWADGSTLLHTWYVDDKEIKDESDSALLLHNLSASYNGAVVKCVLQVGNITQEGSRRLTFVHNGTTSTPLPFHLVTLPITAGCVGGIVVIIVALLVYADRKSLASKYFSRARVCLKRFSTPEQIEIILLNKLTKPSSMVGAALGQCSSISNENQKRNASVQSAPGGAAYQRDGTSAIEMFDEPKQSNRRRPDSPHR